MELFESSRRRLPPPKLDISRPKFFPGQSLSDQDLSDLTTWMEQRLRLEACCADWGIAEGLHVTVDPVDPSRVLIQDGYALNSERQLCVVSAYVKDCLTKPSSRRSSDVTTSVHSVRLIRPKRSSDCRCSGDEDTAQVGPVSIKRSELVVYDLHLIPHECVGGHALGLSSDGSRNCQPSRLRSTALVSGNDCGQSYHKPVPAVSAEHPLSKILSRLPTIQNPLSNDNTLDLRAWLLKEAVNYPSLLNGGPGLISTGLTESELAGILTWLFTTALERECTVEKVSDTIPLARVWARLTSSSVEVLWIDESAPFRRSLGCHRPEFSIDQWRGKDVASAKAAAARCGVNLEVTTLPTSIAELTTHLAKVINSGPHEIFVFEGKGEGEGESHLIAPFPPVFTPPVVTPPVVTPQDGE